MTGQSIQSGESLGVAGSGAIACGLAAVAAERGPVTLAARSAASAARVAERLPAAVSVALGPEALAGCSYVIEAIAEDPVAKATLLAELDTLVGEDCVLATTTSSLDVVTLAEASGRADRFAAFHVFNPVSRMALVELAFPPAASERTRERTWALCTALGKTGVEVPGAPGFVVNRLLFPFLFDAVRLMERTGLEPEAVDRCVTLGLAHPLGPLGLLDLVGLDVAVAIAQALGIGVPGLVHELVADGAVGRKAGRGFYDYPR